MKIKQHEAAWLAGLFDGEGCVVYRADKSGYLVVRLRLGMTHAETILRASDLCSQEGIKTNWYEQALPSGKIIFTMEVGARRAVMALCALILPYSVTKASDLQAASTAVSMVVSSGEHVEALQHLADQIGPRYRRRT